MTNRHVCPTSLLKSIVGADGLILTAEKLLNQAAETTFPPYNIVKSSDSHYRIEIAVAGFSIDDLSIETKEKVLSISGERKDEAAEGTSFLHRGIAGRKFKREFQLADYVEAKGASLVNGILTIELVREVPEAQKARKIDIVKVEAAGVAAE
jgi:molecular chaperone IbpA